MNDLVMIAFNILFQGEPYSTQISDGHTGPVITVRATDRDTVWPFNHVMYELGGSSGGGAFTINENGQIRVRNLGIQDYILLYEL